jgi:hypothetical protein
MQQVIVEIDEQGATEVKVTGVAGKGCQKLSEAIEKSLGSVVADQKTPEFFQQAKQGQQAKAGQ